MSEKTNGVTWNKSSKTKARRTRTIERLVNQLKSGEKPVNEAPEGVFMIGGDGLYAPLTDHDKERINREIETLKTRI